MLWFGVYSGFSGMQFFNDFIYNTYSILYVVRALL
jgi:hypothetical protein